MSDAVFLTGLALVLEQCPQVRGVRVTVHKPHAPVAATFDDVGVTIERARARRHD